MFTLDDDELMFDILEANELDAFLEKAAEQPDSEFGESVAEAADEFRSLIIQIAAVVTDGNVDSISDLQKEHLLSMSALLSANIRQYIAHGFDLGNKKHDEIF